MARNVSETFLKRFRNVSEIYSVTLRNVTATLRNEKLFSRKIKNIFGGDLIFRQFPAISGKFRFGNVSETFPKRFGNVSRRFGNVSETFWKRFGNVSRRVGRLRNGYVTVT